MTAQAPSWLRLLCFASLFAVSFSLGEKDPPAGVHFTIRRRGGPFSIPIAPGEAADLPRLRQSLSIAQTRFNNTRRVIKGNRVVRTPSAGNPFELVGRDGAWYAAMRLGSPPQDIEMDVDMLTTDFFVSWTSSGKGTRFDEIFSTTYKKSKKHLDGKYFARTCTTPQEVFTPPLQNDSIPINFPYCRPMKQVLETLQPAGAILGLAPGPSSLVNDKALGLIDQLLDSGKIPSRMWSIVLLNGREGILTLGNTAADVIDDAKEKIDHRLNDLGNFEHHMENEKKKEQDEEAGVVAPTESDGKGQGAAGPSLAKRRSRKQQPAVANRDPSPWAYTPLEGAAHGYWQVLLAGIWVNGVKILKNHPLIIDLSTPFILAPPAAIKSFYAAIPGARRLPGRNDAFWAFPCRNPPALTFEFAGALFPALNGPQDLKDRPWPHVGGKLSLGRLARGSGYCVGAVVEGKGDAWVLGELGFRGFVMAFEEGKVGFKQYG